MRTWVLTVGLVRTKLTTFERLLVLSELSIAFRAKYSVTPVGKLLARYVSACPETFGLGCGVTGVAE